MKISINGTGLVRFASVEKVTADAQRVRRDGFRSYWLAEHPVGGFDALTVLSAVAQHVPELGFGTAIVPTWPRHPMVLAGQALTAHSAMGERLTLGVGLSHQGMMTQLGIEMEKPIRHLREYLTVLLALLDTGAVDFEGESLTCRARLFVTPQSRPRVLVAALGPQALRVAGRLADGTILAWVGEKTIREHIVPTISAAAADEGRERPQIVATLPVCVTDDSEGVKLRARKAFAMYNELPSYRAMLDREGVAGTADLVIAGGEDEVEERLASLSEAGVDEFAASEFAQSADEILRTRELLKRLSTRAP